MSRSKKEYFDSSSNLQAGVILDRPTYMQKDNSFCCEALIYVRRKYLNNI